VTTARGAVRGDVVAIAAGAWSGRVGEAAGARDHAFTPVKRHLFFLAQGSSPAVGDPFVWRVGAGECYVRNGADGLIASACDAVATAPGDVRVDPAVKERLGDLLAPTVLADRAVTAQWACQRTYAPEGPPRIRFDRDVPWLFWIAGLGGHGATSCAAVGEEAAAMIGA
jgi:glycine/D-amino acid oxidase-like deaminating enzyme